MTLQSDEELLRARQRSRSIAMALMLAGLVILFFLITIAKIAGR
jgi:hypothetical protein